MVPHMFNTCTHACNTPKHVYTLSHTRSLDMLDKMEVPTIPEGYSLVVAMNALLDAIRSVSLVINDEVANTATPTYSPDVVPKPAAKGTYMYAVSRDLLCGDVSVGACHELPLGRNFIIRAGVMIIWLACSHTAEGSL